MNEKDRTSTVGVIVFKEGEVLLVRHTEKAKPPTGIYGFPAGRVESGEGLKTAAKRELYEETGIIVTEEDLVSFSGNHFEETITLKERQEDFTFDLFLCKGYNGEIVPSIDGKTIPEWVNLNNLPSFVLPNISEAIHNAQEFLNAST